MLTDAQALAGIRAHHLFAGLAPEQLQRLLLASAIEEAEAGRPLRRSPLYDRLKAQGAAFGEKLGWERPNWFAGHGEAPHDVYTYGRQNWFTAVGRVAASTSASFWKSTANCLVPLAVLRWAPRASPIAAATPIAGAPRITIVVIALATSLPVLQVCGFNGAEF